MRRLKLQQQGVDMSQLIKFQCKSNSFDPHKRKIRASIDYGLINVPNRFPIYLYKEPREKELYLKVKRYDPDGVLRVIDIKI